MDAFDNQDCHQINQQEITNENDELNQQEDNDDELNQPEILTNSNNTVILSDNKNPENIITGIYIIVQVLLFEI